MARIGLCVALDGNDNVRLNEKRRAVFGCKATGVTEAFDGNMRGADFICRAVLHAEI